MPTMKMEKLPETDALGNPFEMDRDDGFPVAVRKHGELFATPHYETIGRMAMAAVVDALDGCSVEPDGRCPHGYPSWLVALGIV